MSGAGNADCRADLSRRIANGGCHTADTVLALLEIEGDSLAGIVPHPLDPDAFANGIAVFASIFGSIEFTQLRFILVQKQCFPQTGRTERLQLTDPRADLNPAAAGNLVQIQ